MKDSDLYRELLCVTTKPGVFSVYTAEQLWADSHTSKQMLAYHLNPELDISSRQVSFIEESVAWMHERFSLGTKSRIVDFGCGPGLYASRFAACGAEVTGLDFSPLSIGYAREQAAAAGQKIDYQQVNYLEYELCGKFDLISMIMCDFCALSPAQRSCLLEKFRQSLSEQGRVIFDVYSISSFEEKQESVVFEKDLLDGFWSSEPYFGFLASFKYDSEKVSLDRYTIIEEQRRLEVYNWLQYFSQESLEKELREHGLLVESVYGSVAGDPFEPKGLEFAVVAKSA